MAAGTGSIIEAIDYNAIRNKIIAIMGAGSGQSGYGQTLLSTAVATGNQVTKVQWDALRYDILNARIHQDGVTPTIVSAVQGEPIRYGAAHPNTQYSIQADTAIANKFNIGTGQFVVDAGISQTRSTSWQNGLTAVATITFSSSDRARWFFNSGGRLRISANRTGGTSSLQNSSWSSILDTAGILTIGAVSSTINFWALTNTYTTIYTGTGSSQYYSGNIYQVRAACNVADNSLGGASQILIQWNLTDAYTAFRTPSFFPDLVDGTLTLQVDEQRASGILQPVGTGPFTIQRPGYSITAITGS